MKFLRQSRLYPDGLPAVGLLFLRIFVGYAMAIHGLDKIADPFHWGDKFIPGTPMFLQALAAFAEFFGGIAIIFGALFPLACLGVMCTMVVAAMFSLGKGAAIVASPPNPSAESPILYFFIALCLFLTGPGLLAVDYFVFGRKRAAATAT